MSVLSALGHYDGPAKTVMAEMPVVLQPPNRTSKQKSSPQERLDRFWKNFTTEAPGKATAVIPQNKTTAKAALGKTNVASSSGTTTTKSYEDAAAICRAKVEKIVKECRRINQKYRDPHFDLEFDLKMNRRDCLDPLDNTVADSSSDESAGGKTRSQSRRRRRKRRRRGHAGPLSDMDGDESKGADAKVWAGGSLKETEGKKKAMPKDSDQQFRFCPKAVKRVGEIFDDPTFYIDGPTANDVRQGRDGDCWLMAALCTLSNKPGLIEKICVARDEAVGVYGFVFHRDGEWISEIIDDKLYLTKPDYDEVNLERIMWEDRDRINSEESYRKTYQANSGALYFAQCEHPNETWLPLLEKAYAKAHGDYSAIEGGFTGEGIEDLTGGVTSELFTTDILDREYFWREELMKVNEQFLFGCSTGVWGRGWGERKGIMELHAYSVMRAVEMDGQRLVMLKNPWGKGEWKGPWSDGSKEWTPEWLKKLNHRFGDDGAFWISYEDLLRKYQAFDRTRLFGPDWKVTSVWTTLSVPWTLQYHDTKFAFTLARPAPVVLVLSQLDERYFRGLEGQYRFELSFRLHHAGEEDYVVRSQTTYRMNRSVNVELELEAGEYHVLVKIDATRDVGVMPAEDVVRANAKEKREKLIRIGLAYDVAHSKGKIIESPEEEAARKAHEKWKREKEKNELKEKIMYARGRSHYIQVKRLAKNRKALEKRRAKQKAKAEKAEAQEDMAERVSPPPKTGMRPGNTRSVGQPNAVHVRIPKEPRGLKSNRHKKEEGKVKVEEQKVDAQVQTEEQPKPGESPKENEVPAMDGEAKPLQIEGSKADDKKGESVKDGDSSVGPGEITPTTTTSEKSMAGDGKKGFPNTSLAVQTRPDDSTKEDETEGAEKRGRPSDDNPGRHVAEIQPETKILSQNKLNGGAHAESKDALKPADLELGDLSQEEIFYSAHQDQTSSTDPGTSSDCEDSDNSNPNPGFSGNPRSPLAPHNRQRRRPRPPATPPPDFRRPPLSVPRHMSMRGQSPPPAPRGFVSDDESLSSISSPSEISDRELEYHFEEQNSRPAQVRVPAPPPGYGVADKSEDESERDPWNAVVVVGFRVYYRLGQDGGEEGEAEEPVKVRVIRPIWFPGEEDGRTEKEKVVLEGKVKETGMDESMVLDLDDSAKDATLQSSEKVQSENPKEEGKGINDDEAEPEDEEKRDNVNKDDEKGEITKLEDNESVATRTGADTAKDSEPKSKVRKEEDGQSE